jgi:hypothetical protein
MHMSLCLWHPSRGRCHCHEPQLAHRVGKALTCACAHTWPFRVPTPYTRLLTCPLSCVVAWTRCLVWRVLLSAQRRNGHRRCDARERLPSPKHTAHTLAHNRLCFTVTAKRERQQSWSELDTAGHSHPARTCSSLLALEQDHMPRLRCTPTQCTVTAMHAQHGAAVEAPAAPRPKR